MRVSVVSIGILALALSAFPHGQNTEGKESQANEARLGMAPRSSPNDYQAHAQAGNVTVAAEFTGHSVPRPEGSLSTEDYLVVETGLFGAAGERIQMSTDNFSLRINGKKTLTSQPYGFVFSSLKDPNWVPPDQGEKKSKGGLSTGGQSDTGPPPPVHVPVELQRAMAQYVQKSALPEGERELPKAGLIFFQYRGKTKGIHSLELIYAGPTGKATLALQP
jgi:hypothetical protein